MLLCEGDKILYKKALRKLTKKPQCKSLIIVKKNLSQLSLPPQPLIDVEFEVLPPDKATMQEILAPIPKIHWFDIDQRIEQAHICYVGRHQGHVIYMAWIAINQCYSYYLERRYNLADNECFLYNAYTLPDYRGKNIHSLMQYHHLQYMRQKNFRRNLAFIQTDNKAARKMPQKLNYEQVGITGFIEISSIRFYFHRDGGAFTALKQRNFLRRV